MERKNTQKSAVERLKYGEGKGKKIKGAKRRKVKQGRREVGKEFGNKAKRGNDERTLTFELVSR